MPSEGQSNEYEAQIYILEPQRTIGLFV